MIGSIVKVIVDRPLGSCHPKHRDIYYSVNYGYIPSVMAPDGEEQDAYILGVDQPVSEFVGKVIAVIHRFDDVEEKWVVAPENAPFTKEEIVAQVAFQEQYFQTEIRMWELQLVRCGVADLEWIQAMQQEAFAALLEKYQDYDISPAAEEMDKVLARFEQPWSTYFFITANDERVGVIRVIDKKDGSRKRISPIWIMPEYRNKGYAQQAIIAAEDKYGSYHWCLDTILQEEGNLHLYEKLGYHQTGRVDKVNDLMDIVYYEKD